MDLYGQKSHSIPQKTTIIILEIIFLYFSYWILFQAGGSLLLNWIGLGEAAAPLERRMIIFIFSIIVFLRLGFTMLYLLKRKMLWEESLSVAFAFALYSIGLSLLALPTHRQLAAIDAMGIALFLAGSVLNTLSELQRHFWKQRDSNKGKLYTQGLFRYAMHINYFGDVCWVTAYAIITRNLYAAIIPCLLVGFFAFYNIPKLDEHLASKYEDDYDAYRQKTPKLIPFLY